MSHFTVGFDELSMFFEDADMEHVRLTSGPADIADVLKVDVQGLTLEVGEYSWQVASRGSASDKHTTICTAHRQPGAQFNGVDTQAKVAVAYGPNSEVFGTGPGRVPFAVLTIENEELSTAAKILGREPAPMAAGEVKKHTCRPTDRMQRLVTALDREIRRSQFREVQAPLASRFHDEVLLSVLSMIGGDDPSGTTAPMGRLAALDIVTACDEYAMANRYQSITALDLSRASHYSERRIRSAFQEIVDMSPMRFMRLRALGEIRKELLSAEPASVTDVAMMWGMTELGRMAGAYRDLFGELPSATLRSSRDRSGPSSARAL